MRPHIREQSLQQAIPLRFPSRSLVGTSVSSTKAGLIDGVPPDVGIRLGRGRRVAMRRFFGRKCVTFVVRYHWKSRAPPRSPSKTGVSSVHL